MAREASECGSVDYHVGAAEGLRDSMVTGVGVGYFKFSVLLNRQHRAAINTQRQNMWQRLGFVQSPSWRNGDSAWGERSWMRQSTMPQKANTLCARAGARDATFESVADVGEPRFAP